MTDSTTIDERPAADEQLPELHESAALGAEGHAAEEPLKDRLLLPLLLPLLSMAAVALLAINVSRVLLAGDSDSALAIGITLLLTILIGATVMSAMPRAKTSARWSSPWCVGLFVVAMAGLIALGPSLDDGQGGAAANPNIYVPGPAASTVDVTAGPGLTLQRRRVHLATTTPRPASSQINYGGATGHTLAIQDPKFNGFELGTDAGAKKAGNVKLAARHLHDLLHRARSRGRRHEGHHHRRRLMRAKLVGVLGALLISGLLLAGCGGSDSGSQGYVEPKGPAVQTLDIHAGNFYFKPDTLTAEAGITKIDLTDDGGIHTLVFDGAFAGFMLEVSGGGDSQLGQGRPEAREVHLLLQRHRAPRPGDGRHHHRQVIGRRSSPSGPPRPARRAPG